MRRREILMSRRGLSVGDSRDHQDGRDSGPTLDRRQFLKRAGALGLIVAAPPVLQRYWALDQTMIPSDRFGNTHQLFADWAEALEPRSLDWLVWIKAPPDRSSPFAEVIAARDIPALLDGGHWTMIFDDRLAMNGPTNLIRYVEGELSRLAGAPARVVSVNGTVMRGGSA